MLVQSLGELVQRGGDLQALQQHGLLALQADVLGPLDEATQITLGLHIATNAEVARALLEQRVGGGLLGHLLLRTGSGGNLLADRLLGCLWCMKKNRDQRTMAKNTSRPTAHTKCD